MKHTLDELLNDERVVTIKEFLDEKYGIRETETSEDTSTLYILIRDNYIISLSYYNDDKELIAVSITGFYWDNSTLGMTYYSFYTMHFFVDYFKKWIVKHKNILDGYRLTKEL